MVEKIPQGYKKTEAGVIPETWACLRLGDVSQKIGSGITPTGGSRKYKLVGHPFVRSQNVLWGKLDLSEIVYIADDTHTTFIGTEIKKDDVLLNITGASIGRAAIANDDIIGGNVNQHVCIIRPIQTELNSVFLCTYLISSAGQKYIDSFQSGGNRQGLNFKQIASILIPVPPQHEQVAIAEALSDMGSLISSLEKLISKKQRTKQGVIQELLMGKKRLSGFGGELNSIGYKKTEAGIVPEDWEVKTIGMLFSFKNGLNKAKEYFGYGTPIVNYMDVYSKRGLVADDIQGRVFVSADEIKAFDVQKGDVFFTRTSETPEEVGVSTTILEDLKDTVFSGFILRARPKTESLDIYYQKYCFSSSIIRHKIVSSCTYTTRALTNGRSLSTISLPIPPLPEQIAIAQFLSDMDEEIEKLIAKLNKYKAIKRGMMQELLIGKRRLV
ncbi:Type-1 restriction enzyme EcoKI specificity protein [Sporomusa silvacetica DSM 10669]|uniref:Type-1 restriction enzyme EcoKI specificity protein n=1 Tax=Sporomusa silvacetica DSM 10669 TaxID=1123289 RepID=A0ABZ3IUD6_9FIRM|nr:restriction endonuclease subunit S [Sporomusa silvacetica]OZC19648.1 type-1 restriction enzyme EcoKI specificity protein [Sporomusa silvacetica DSM 10669]